MFGFTKYKYIAVIVYLSRVDSTTEKYWQEIKFWFFQKNIKSAEIESKFIFWAGVSYKFN